VNSVTSVGFCQVIPRGGVVTSFIRFVFVQTSCKFEKQKRQAGRCGRATGDLETK